MDDEMYEVPERPLRDRRQFLIKLLWIGIWLAFMSAPVKNLVVGGHGSWARALGGLGLTVFVGVYLSLLLRHTSKALDRHCVLAAIAFLGALGVALSLALGVPWLVLFVYVSVSAGATLPIRISRWLIGLVTAVMVAIGVGLDEAGATVFALVFPALLGGFAMSGVRQLVRTTIQLHEARATVAQLAANEERLRLARDLHDLLGHSLSLITLKSELAGRMLPDHPGRAAEQVADIERVSRQALVDVRSAVTGYRRPTLPGELAGARTALAAAGITADVPAEAPDGLPEEPEAVLAWGLREAVTNVVRHSGARHCTVTLGPRQTPQGPVLELTVADDGRGASGAEAGNGLTGLAERLAEAGGMLTTEAPVGGGAAMRGGFTLTLRVPVVGHDLGSTR